VLDRWGTSCKELGRPPGNQSWNSAQRRRGERRQRGSPALSLPSRGDPGAAPWLSAGLGVAPVASRNNPAALTGHETPCGRDRDGALRRAIRARAPIPLMVGRMNETRRRVVGSAPGPRQCCLPSVRDWRDRRCRRAAPDISRRQGRPGREPSAAMRRAQIPRSITRRAWPLDSSAEGRSRPLRDLGDDPGDRSFDLRVGQRALARLEPYIDRNRFRTFGQTLALINVKDADLRD
jgi:hypothetical protein